MSHEEPATEVQAYRIRDWGVHFENSRTREIKNLTAVLIPNKLDGDGYTELVAGHEDGGLHYAAWVLITLVASKCQPRGTLIRDTLKPHDPASLSRMTRLPAKAFKEALARLVQIGWLEMVAVDSLDVTAIPQEGAGETPQGAAKTPRPAVSLAPARAPTELKGTKGNCTEENGTEPNLPGAGTREAAEKNGGGGDFRCLDQIKPIHVPSDAVMERLQKQLLVDAPGCVPDGDKGLLMLMSASERAIEIGEKPAALFASLIREGRWGLIDEPQKVRATRRLELYRKNQSQSKQ